MFRFTCGPELKMALARLGVVTGVLPNSIYKVGLRLGVAGDVSWIRLDCA